MSWTLSETQSGGTTITLPNPQGLARRQLEKSVSNETVNGTSRKDISNRKEQYILQYRRRTQAEVAQILAFYNLKKTAILEVSDGSLLIAPTEVHVDMANRDYNTKGSEFREDLDLILTEVS